MSAEEAKGGAAARDGAAGLTFEEFMARLEWLSDEEKEELIRGLSARHKAEFGARWSFWAHEGQKAPVGDWRVWLICAGRGFGKTRAGSEWVHEKARETRDARIALVGATEDDVRRVMIEGASGLLALADEEDEVLWKRGAGEVHFGRSGAVAYVYSAASGERLRGPEHHAAWCDELAAWRDGDAAWDNLMMGMRLGDNPQTLVTTTPKAVPLMRRVMKLSGLAQRGGATTVNPHLPDAFVAAMQETYGGSRLGRQELQGEMIDDVAGALWTRKAIETCRVAAGDVPVRARVVVAVDPPAGTEGDACGIVAVLLGGDGIGYVVEDASVTGLSPEGWARAVADCAARHRADRVVAEKNQGGAMVESVLRAADAVLPLTLVHASVGKVTRAEPVAALYETGKVRHAGAFPELEDQLCGLIVGGGYQGPGRSPDRADALVWALNELLLAHAPAAPAVRAL